LKRFKNVSSVATRVEQLSVLGSLGQLVWPSKVNGW